MHVVPRPQANTDNTVNTEFAEAEASHLVDFAVRSAIRRA